MDRRRAGRTVVRPVTVTVLKGDAGQAAAPRSTDRAALSRNATVLRGRSSPRRSTLSLACGIGRQRGAERNTEEPDDRPRERYSDRRCEQLRPALVPGDKRSGVVLVGLGVWGDRPGEGEHGEEFAHAERHEDGDERSRPYATWRFAQFYGEGHKKDRERLGAEAVEVLAGKAVPPIDQPADGERCCDDDEQRG